MKSPKTMTYRGKVYHFYLNMISKRYALQAIGRLRKAGIPTQYLPIDKNQYALYTLRDKPKR